MTIQPAPTERAWARKKVKRAFLLAVYCKLAQWRIMRVRNGHYYSPVPSLKNIERDAHRIFDRSLRALPGVDLNEAAQVALLAELATYYQEQPFSDRPRDGLRYHFDNFWYGRADGLFLYAMMRLFKPRQIIEVGSGFSSAVMLDTNERFMDMSVRVTFIEPDSARLRALIKQQDRTSVEIVEQPIQQIDRSLVDGLRANDILFIDSSHVSKVGSDVNHILFELLPRLKSGVLVHFHDVLYPFEYHMKWCELGMWWNESYLLRAFLQYNTQFSIRFWNDFMMRFHQQDIATLMPLCLDPPSFGVGGSLWLQRT